MTKNYHFHTGDIDALKLDKNDRRYLILNYQQPRIIMPTFAPEVDPYLSHDPHITEHEDAFCEAMEAAAAASTEYRKAKEKVTGLLQQSLRKMFPKWTIFQRAESVEERRFMPCYLRQYSVVRGRSHKCRYFRLESDPVIVFNMESPELTEWYCDAKAINADGKALSGKTRGSNSYDLVQLRGYMFPILIDESPWHDPLSEFVTWCENPESDSSIKMFHVLPNIEL